MRQAVSERPTGRDSHWKGPALLSWRPWRPWRFVLIRTASALDAFDVELRVRRDREDQLVTGASSRLVVGRVTRLSLFLASRCLEEATTCGEDETCTADGCRPRAIDPGDLPDW